MGTLMARSNAAQWRTRIRRRNRKRSDGAVAIEVAIDRSDAAAIRALGTWSSALAFLLTLRVLPEIG